MNIRKRPIIPEAKLSEGPHTSDKINARKFRKLLYTTLYGDNGSGPLTFSFFGDPSSIRDLDGIATNLLYGRIDADNDAILPKITSLQQVGKKTSTSVLVTFFAQAVNEFRNNFTTERFGFQALKIRDSPYRDLRIVNGYQNADTIHSEMMELYYETHVRQYLLTKSEQIRDFHDFLILFLGDFFPNHMIPQRMPLTRSSFVISGKNTPLSSGLVVEFASADHNDDETKHKDFLLSPAYNVILKGAANYGLMVDKHAPWRMVANIASPNMLKYIQGKGLNINPDLATRLKSDGTPFTPKDVMNVFFEKVYLRDIEVLKRTIFSLYRKFLVTNSYFTQSTVSNCDIRKAAAHEATLTQESIDRKNYSYEDLENDYDQIYWLNQYLIIRLLEGGVRLNQERLVKQFDKIQNIVKYVSYEKALTYVNEYVKNYVVTGYGPLSSTIKDFEKYAFSKTSNIQVSELASSIQN